MKNLLEAMHSLKESKELLTDAQKEEVRKEIETMVYQLKQDGFTKEDLEAILEESPYSEEGILGNDALYEIDDIDMSDDDIEEEVAKVALEALKDILEKVDESKELKEDEEKPLANESEIFKNISDSLVNYKAFTANFGSVVKVLKFQTTYLIYKSEAKNYDEYIYKADNKDEIEGWLYGCVQVANGILKPVEK